ncbi:EAL domain-containing protein [Photobacterium leiognathi]|uniref:EAL domain-containing protein n=1 Tax=Photobacterium leiognathi TaxID=553611 RepID=UPI002981352D|nr:EAL domain-containing protein [Photobacterium leiognathi]
MKIMIIEDEPLQSFNLKMQLSKLGYVDVVIASNLLEVQKELNNNSIDLFFCDLHLPDADGVCLLSSYITDSLNSGVVIVSVADDKIKNLTVGMCNQLGYRYVSMLNKPFKLDDLDQVIKNYLSHQNVEKTYDFKINSREMNQFLIEERFFPLYQPQFSFVSGDFIGVEALVRLEHPKLGLLMPSSFMKLIKKYSLIKELYIFMLDKTTKALGVLNSDIQLSLNINQELLDWELYEKTKEICDKNNYNLNSLTLELTEDDAYNLTPLSLENLARLSMHGVKFSIDDFGTGFASLEMLIDLPITELKIDRKFVFNALHDYRHLQLTKASVRLAHSLGIDCVAEGVEDIETWEFLKQIGVDVCQGYYTGKPMSIHDLNALRTLAKTANNLDVISKKFNGIAIFDKEIIRSNAMKKIFKNYFNLHDVFVSSSTEELSQVLRDIPISLIIIEGNSLSLIDSEEFYSLIDDEKVFLLTNNKDDSKLLKAEKTIKKSEDLFEMVRFLHENIIEYFDRGVKPQISLSKREQDVAQLLLAGFSNKYISYELGISQKTVSTFKMRIFKKMNVKSLIELARCLNI